MNRVLVPVFGDDGDQAALDAAGALACGAKARIEAKHFHRDPVALLPFMGEGVDPRAMERLVSDFTQKNDQRRQGIANRVGAWAHRAGLSAPNEGDGPGVVFEDVMGNMPDCIVPHARIADVTVFPRGFGHDNAEREAMADVTLLESGRPTLLAPEIPTSTIGKRIVVAWNGSAEAARALSAAMPLCQRADQVTIIAVDPDYGTEPLDEGDISRDPKAIANTLVMNGIKAQAITAGQHGDDIPDALTREAKTVDADLIVIGAYSRSRLRQWFLGGVTRSYRDGGSIAVLMTH